ncbi:MAG: MFS transporter [Chloroflexi bacterium]|nr:MFS transporter [Chloroflexota bacterium]
MSYAPILVALRDAFQTTNAWAGATVSVYGLALACSQLVAGPLADRFSAKRLLVGGLLLYSGASVLAYLAGQVEVFLLARALQGAGAATGLVVGGAVITDRFPHATRTRAMAALQMFNTVGGTLGAILGSAIAVVFIWQANSLVLAAAGLLVAGAAAAFLPQVAAPAQRLSLSAVGAVLRYRATRGVLLLAFVQWFAQFIYVAYTPAVLRERAGLAEAAIGLIFLPNPLGVFVGAHLGGRLAGRYSARRLIFVGAWLAIAWTALYVASVLLAPAAWLPVALALCFGGFSLGLGLGVPAQLTLMVERFARNRGAAVGTYASLRYFGGALGPLATGLMLDRFGLASGFATATLVMALGAIAAHRFMASSDARGHHSA